MAEKLHPVRGMKDLFNEDYNAHEYIISTAKSVAELYGFEGASVPILEHTGVFARTLGEASDVVSKEMYSFLDKSNDSLTMRPEFTAGIMRAFISGGMHHQLPMKLFSNGPLFRYDRPQAGRLRQFHQLNYEFLGADGVYSDAEMLMLAQHTFEALGIAGDFTLELNSLGCKESRTRYQEMLFDYFTQYSNELSEDSKRRLLKNPMRILDSKDNGDKKIVATAPSIESSYSAEAHKYFNDLQNLLSIMNVHYKLNPKLVRGLDYYCHTAFEFTTDKLGAQSAIGGGGRYDGLSKIMGGPEMPSIGFALGIERIALMKRFTTIATRPIFIIPIGDENLEHAATIAANLRTQNIPTMLEHKGKIARRMQNADKARARYVVFIGSDEVASGNYKVKDMDNGQESFMSLEAIGHLK